MASVVVIQFRLLSDPNVDQSTFAFFPDVFEGLPLLSCPFTFSRGGLRARKPSEAIS